MRHAGRDRLATVRRDFFLNPDERLTEQERALMTAMLHTLVGDVADELRASLPAGTTVANDDGDSELVAELSSAGLLDHPQLIELLLRRADEEQIASAVKARSGRREARLLQSLVSDESAAISAAAMALILARGRRRDRFGQPRVELDDLPQDCAVALANAVCAALRSRLTVTSGQSADRYLADASVVLLTRHDSSRRLEELAADLVRLLDEGGRLDDDLLAAAADEGEMTLVGQAFARRAGIDAASAADLLHSGEGARLMLLLRMADVTRDFAARLLAGPGDLLGVADAGREIARFDSIKPEDVDRAREWLRLDPGYREALAALGRDHGQRAF